MRFLLAIVLASFASACLPASADEPKAPPAAAAPPPGDHHGGDIPSHFKDLKVLPADISKDQLMSIMRNMSQGLGVRCGFCHLMEPKDFAADTKHKGIAREMMKMTDGINKQMFTWPDAPKATCYMCHHGEEKPVLKAPHGAHDEPPGKAPPAP